MWSRKPNTSNNTERFLLHKCIHAYMYVCIYVRAYTHPHLSDVPVNSGCCGPVGVSALRMPMMQKNGTGREHPKNLRQRVQIWRLSPYSLLIRYLDPLGRTGSPEPKYMVSRTAIIPMIFRQWPVLVAPNPKGPCT